MTEEEMDVEQARARSFAISVSAIAMTKLHRATALVAVAMALATIIDTTDFADGVTHEDILTDFNNAVKDCLKNMRVAEKEKY